MNCESVYINARRNSVFFVPSARNPNNLAQATKKRSVGAVGKLNELDFGILFVRLVAYTYLQHIQAFPDDNTARIQFCFLCCTDDILKEGKYPLGNQSAAERIFLFW